MPKNGEVVPRLGRAIQVKKFQFPRLACKRRLIVFTAHLKWKSYGKKVFTTLFKNNSGVLTRKELLYHCKHKIDQRLDSFNELELVLTCVQRTTKYKRLTNPCGGQ